MKKYEYKFVDVPRAGGLKAKTGCSFEACKKIILSEAEQGWRFKQVVVPFNEKSGLDIPIGYQIIFEKEV